VAKCEVVVGAFCKGAAKVWFYGWDIPALIALLSGQFLVCGAILLLAGGSAGALWLYGERLEAKAAPAKIAALRRSKGLDP
jgi:hypothetical protein